MELKMELKIKLKLQEYTKTMALTEKAKYSP